MFIYRRKMTMVHYSDKKKHVWLGKSDVGGDIWQMVSFILKETCVGCCQNECNKT